MAKRLFVGNLPYQTNDQQLHELFSQVGAVESVSVITDKYSGRSKGFAFVEMASDSDAQAAVQQFNGYQLDGRAIVVNEARPMEDRSSGGGGGFHRGGGDRRGRGDRRGGFGGRGGDRRGGFDRQNRW